MEDCTVVIFLNTHHKNDVERFNLLLYPSIKFIKEKIIVVPKNVYNLKTDSSYRLLLDKKIVGDNYTIKSYDKQMMLKLYVSKFINTKYYLILDSDIIVNKEFTVKDFFNENNKINLSIYNSSKHINNKHNEHYVWIQNAKNILNIKNIKEPFYYANTPVLMITEVVIKLINYLDEKTNGFLKYYKKYNRWQKFSEYTLYFLFAQKYHYYENNSDTPGSVSGVWSKKDSIYNLNNKSIFFVIQSHLNINIQTITNFLSNRMNTFGKNLNYSYKTLEKNIMDENFKQLN